MALKTNPETPFVVFKLHPLEPASAAIKRHILRRSAAIGVEQRRIKILHSGRMSELAKQSGGMVVINSTSAFSALHHSVAVLVLGDAVFRHAALVTLGENEADVASFFKLRQAKSPLLIDTFIAELKSESLIPGDFYVSRGRQVAISGIMERLKQLQPMPRICKEARG
jgi:capsular polysaccharide export protein